MFIERFESNLILDARNRRKKFIEDLKRDIKIENSNQEIMESIKNTNSLKKDWEAIGKDFPTR